MTAPHWDTGVNFIPDVYAPTWVYKPLSGWKRFCNKWLKCRFEREKAGYWFYRLDNTTYVCSYETYAKIQKAIDDRPPLG